MIDSPVVLLRSFLPGNLSLRCRANLEIILERSGEPADQQIDGWAKADTGQKVDFLEALSGDALEWRKHLPFLSEQGEGLGRTKE